MLLAQLFIEPNELRLSAPDAQIQDERRDLGAPEISRFLDWSRRYRDLAPKRDDDRPLRALGQEIYQWLDGRMRWIERLQQQARPPLVVELIAPVAPDHNALAVLEAPWELLADARGWLAARDELRYTPVRRFGRPGTPAAPSSDYRLSLLFMAAAPADVPELAYEAEEAAILQATGRLGLDLTVEETGTLADLGERLREGLMGGPFDALHLSCHGMLRPVPALALEDDAGRLKVATAKDLIRELTGHLPRFLMLSACHTAEGTAVLESLASELLGSGVPAVLGWGSSVADRDAIDLAEALYRELAARKTAPEAVSLARFRILNPPPGEKPAADWHLARLYLGPEGGGPICKGTMARLALHPDRAAKTFLDKHRQRVPIAGRYEFVGRRRQIQEALRALRGRDHASLLIHGMGQQGKSSLAGRIATRLPDHALAVVYEHYDAAAILDAIGEAVENDAVAKLITEYRPRVADNPTGLRHALRGIIHGPCRQFLPGERPGEAARQRPLLLVLDDFERLLDPPAGGFHRVKADLVPVARAIIDAFDSADTELALLITSRYRFALGSAHDDSAARLYALPLPEMSPNEQAKQVRHKIEDLDKATLDEKRLGRCISCSLGSPGLLDRLLRMAIAKPALCDQALAQMERYKSSGEKPSDETLAAFIDNLILDTLIGALDAKELDLLRASTLFETPVPLAALEAMANARKLDGGGPPGERLLAFGLWNQVADPVDAERPAALLSRIAQPKLEALTEEEKHVTADAILQPLFRCWSGGGGRAHRPWITSLELTRLALLALDTSTRIMVLATTASVAARWLHRSSRLREAAELSQACIAVLDTATTPVPIELLRIAAESAFDVAEMENARSYYARAIDWLNTHSAMITPLERARLLVEYHRVLVHDGRPDDAIAAIEQAQQIFMDQKADSDRAATLSAMARIKASKGQVDEALQLHSQALQLYETLDDMHGRAVAMSDIARLKAHKGEIDRAVTLHDEALQIYTSLGRARDRAVALGEIARLKAQKGAVDEALELNEEYLQIASQLGDLRERAVALGNIARLKAARGEVDEALLLQAEELQVYETLGDVRGRATALGHIARLLAQKGEIDEALKLQSEALQVFTALGAARERAVTLGDIARLKAQQGEVDEALKLQGEALEVYASLGDVRGRAVTLVDVARIKANSGELDEALVLSEESVQIARQLGDPRERAIALNNIARVKHQMGEVDEALKLHGEELQVYASLGDVRSRAVALGDIARLKAQKGEVDEALKLHRERLQIFDQLGDVGERAQTLWSMAQIELQKGGSPLLPIARDRLNESYDINLRLGRLDGICFVGLDLGQVLAMDGDIDKAIQILERSRDGFLKLGRQDWAQQTEALIAQVRQLPRKTD